MVAISFGAYVSVSRAGAVVDAAAFVPKDAGYSIEVSCTPGVRWAGTYLVISDQGASSSHDASGSCPRSGKASFTGYGATMSIVLQKQSEEGRILVNMMRDGAPVASGETEQPYGVVTVAK